MKSSEKDTESIERRYGAIKSDFEIIRAIVPKAEEVKNLINQ